MPPFKSPPGEFESERGERVRPGSPNIRGLGKPQPKNIPVGIAPPDPMNVVSTFDTRPIAAYDFADTQVVEMGPGEVLVPQDVSFTVPLGYTGVLRRVRVTFTPGAVVNLTSPVVNMFTMSLLRDAGNIARNSIDFYGELGEYEWLTHQVFGQGTSMGLRMISTGWAVPSSALDTVIVAVTFMGTLIPTHGRPPEIEIASDPVLVRDYDVMRRSAPITAAAGQQGDVS